MKNPSPEKSERYFEVLLNTKFWLSRSFLKIFELLREFLFVFIFIFQKKKKKSRMFNVAKPTGKWLYWLWSCYWSIGLGPIVSRPFKTRSKALNPMGQKEKLESHAPQMHQESSLYHINNKNATFILIFLYSFFTFRGDF